MWDRFAKVNRSGIELELKKLNKYKKSSSVLSRVYIFDLTVLISDV